MGRRLILHKTGFNRYMFFTSYFIDVDTFYLFLNWFSTRVSDNRKYVCRRLYACINTRKFKGLDSREITSLPEIKEVINVARHFNHRRKEIACSSQELFAYDESLQHPTIAVLLIKILNFFDHSVVFTCPKVIAVVCVMINLWIAMFENSALERSIFKLTRDLICQSNCTF